MIIKKWKHAKDPEITIAKISLTQTVLACVPLDESGDVIVGVDGLFILLHDSLLRGLGKVQNENEVP